MFNVDLVILPDTIYIVCPAYFNAVVERIQYYIRYSASKDILFSLVCILYIKGIGSKLSMSVDYIRAGKIDDYIYDNNAIIIDVRKEDEYNLTHIKNAVNIPYDKLEQMLGNIKNFDRRKVYVIYCDRGSLSMSVCRKMSMQGLRTITVVGGIKQYRGNYLTR